MHHLHFLLDGIRPAEHCQELLPNPSSTGCTCAPGSIPLLSRSPHDLEDNSEVPTGRQDHFPVMGITLTDTCVLPSRESLTNLPVRRSASKRRRLPGFTTPIQVTHPALILNQTHLRLQLPAFASSSAYHSRTVHTVYSNIVLYSKLVSAPAPSPIS